LDGDEAAAASISARSLSVSSTSAAARFSSRRWSLRVPGDGHDPRLGKPVERRGRWGSTGRGLVGSGTGLRAAPSPASRSPAALVELATGPGSSSTWSSLPLPSGCRPRWRWRLASGPAVGPVQRGDPLTADDAHGGGAVDCGRGQPEGGECAGRAHSVAFTLDRHGHLFPGHDDELPDRLDAMHAEGLQRSLGGAVVDRAHGSSEKAPDT
jgi:hypothetical protein